MALMGTEKDRIRSIGAVRGSCSRYREILSAKKYRKILHKIDRGSEMLNPTATGFSVGDLQVALFSATILEMAVW